jgi:hypothetical protein
MAAASACLPSHSMDDDVCVLEVGLPAKLQKGRKESM